MGLDDWEERDKLGREIDIDKNIDLDRKINIDIDRYR